MPSHYGYVQAKLLEFPLESLTKKSSVGPSFNCTTGTSKRDKLISGTYVAK